jgi:hypothetical protein
MNDYRDGTDRFARMLPVAVTMVPVVAFRTVPF